MHHDLVIIGTGSGLSVVAMEFGIIAADLARRPYWIHPALTEIVQNALLDMRMAA